MSKPAAARERFADRLREADLSTERFVDVQDGSKACLNHTQYDADADQLIGNYGVYAGTGGNDRGAYLIDVDVDDYDDYDDDALEAVNDLPATFTVESPHTVEDNPGHRYYAVDGDPAAVVQDVRNDRDLENPGMSWGEIRVRNQYVVGPGSQIDDCDKDWHDCTTDDEGWYRISEDQPIATISEEEFAELLEADQSTDDDWDPFDDFDGSAPGEDNDNDNDDADDTDHTGDAEAVAKAYPWIMQYLAFGDVDDRSESDWAVCRELVDNDVSKSDAYELLNDSSHTKVSERGQTYWQRTWSKAQKEASSPGGSSTEDTDADGDWTDKAARISSRAADRNSSVTLKNARTQIAGLAADSNEFLTPAGDGGELNKLPLWVYEEQDGCYERRGDAQISSDLTGTAGELSTADQDEIANLVRRDTITPREELDAKDEDSLLLNLEDCVYDVDAGEPREDSPEYNFRHVHPFEYDRDADAGPVLDFLEEVVEHDYEVRTLLEFIGYCFEDGYPDPHFLLLHGSGGNGKGIFFDVVEALIGRANTSSVELDQMIGDGSYMMAELDGSFVNIDGDVGTSSIGTEELSIIKKLTGQDGIQVQRKFEHPFELRNRAKLMFAANKPPRFQDRTHALARRFMVIPFPYEFVENPDSGQKQRRPYRELMEELTSDEALAGLFNEAMDAYQGVLERGHFSIEKQGSNMERLEAYRRDSDPIVGFAHQFIVNKQSHAIPKDAVFALYTTIAQAEGEYPADRGVFFRKLSQATPIDIYGARPQVNGKRMQICDHLWLQAPALEYLSDSARDEINALMANRHPGNADYATDFLGLTPDSESESEPEPEPKENGDGDLDPTATQAVARVVQNDPGILFADLRSTLGMDHDLPPETANDAIERAVKQGKVIQDGSQYRPA